MKRIRVAILSLGLVAVGCVSINGTRTAPDGSVLTIKTTRFAWASEGINFTLQDTNGFKTTLAVQKSTVDSAAIGAVAKGVAEGMAAGVTK